jgi:hypothetical protein
LRELYIYYRVNDGDAPAALQAARSMQQRLREQHPGLQARLLRRPQAGSDGLQTWMETYALPDAGVTTALEDEITRAASAWAAYISGPRHCEVFTPCA